MRLHKSLRKSGAIFKAVLWLVLIVAAAENNAQDSGNAGAAALDWISRENLPEDMLKICPRNCDGMYVERMRSYEGIENDPRNSQIEVVSDLTEVTGEDNVVSMDGNVELIQGWRSVEADNVRILQGEDRIELSGDIQMREPGLLITGRSASLESTTQAMQFDEAEFVLHNLGVRGTAEQVGRDANGRFYISNATYSTCEPGDESWTLSAREISIDENQLFATAKSMTIRVGNVPIFYAPWFAFPVGDGRQTGLLYPDISLGSDNGFDMTQPIYLNLAPNYDLTVAPRYMSKRGTGLELEARYLSATSFNRITTAFLPDDGGGNDDKHLGKQRWQVSALHTGDWGQLHSLIDYSQVSDKDYFEDLGSANNQPQTRTYLKQLASLSRDTEHWTTSISAQRYQTIAENFTDTYREVPSITFNGIYHFANLEWTFNHQWADYYHPQDKIPNSAPMLRADADGSWVTGQRARFDYGVAKKFVVPWGIFTTELLSKFRIYALDAPLAGYQDRNPGIYANGIRLFTEGNLERSTTLFGSRWIQTLEPSIQYLNITAHEQGDIPVFDTRAATPSYKGLFRANRFVGGDRVDNANQVTWGLSSRLIDPEHGNQVASLSVGQNLYIEDRQSHTNELFTLGLGDPNNYQIDDPRYLLALAAEKEREALRGDQSNIITEADLRLGPEWSLTAALHLNTSSNNFERGHLNFSYLASNQLSAFNLGYRFVARELSFADINNDNLVQSNELFNGDTSQYDLSGFRAIDDRWTVVARWRQDVALNRPLETLAGVRYDDCCWSVGVFWRRWLKRDDDILVAQTDLQQDSGIFINFQLKGLAGVGQGIESLLEDSIPGYNREIF